MGHIVNAKSMRLGCSTMWCDQWYTENLYYSEYLHAMFRIRFFCLYIFTERHFDRKAIFFSHFEILRYYKNIYVEIYYYDGKLETEFEDYKFELFIKHYNLPKNKDPENRKPFFLFSTLKFMIILEWICSVKLKRFKKHHIKRLMLVFRVNKVKILNKFVRSWSKKKYFGYLNRYRLHFLLFIVLYLQTKSIISKTSIWSIANRNVILRRLYFASGNEHEIRFWMLCAIRYLSYIFKLLTKFHNIYVHFFLTHNNCVNARFLSRFIARKLKQGYPVKELLNPIRKELIFLMSISITPVMSYFVKILKKYYNSKDRIILVKSLFKSILSFIFSNYFKIIKYKYLKDKTFFTLDLFVIYVWFNDKILVWINTIYLKKIINNDLNYLKILDCANKYYKKKIAYICFFENKLYFNTANYAFFPKISSNYFLNYILKFENFFNILYNHVFVNKTCLIHDIHLNNDLNNDFVFRYRAANINFNRFFRYTYWIYNYSKMYTFLGINYLKSRIKIHTKGNNLIGYKMYLSGRFTRKQRAGHYWFSKGKVPLNTITAFIDFAFFTIPLVNSAITVKVWLYKSSDIDNKHYIKLI